MSPKQANPSLGKMLSTMYRIYSQHMMELIAPYGFNMTDLAIILGLDTNPGASLNAFAKEKKINKAILSKAIKKLEAEGLLLLQKDEAHKQRFKIFLSAKAKKLVPELRGHIQAYEDTVFAKLKEADIKAYRDTFASIYEIEVDGS